MGLLLLGVAWLAKAEPGAQWYVPMEGMPSEDWRRKTQVETWCGPQNLPVGGRIVLEGGVEVRLFRREGEGAGFLSFAPFVEADANNRAVLPDGTVVCLREVAASQERGKPWISFALEGDEIVGRESKGMSAEAGLLKLVLEQTPGTLPVRTAQLEIFEQATGKSLQGSYLEDPSSNVILAPLMPRGKMRVLWTCYFGGMQELEIPARLGEVVRTKSAAVRSCGDVLRRKGETTVLFWSENAGTHSVALPAAEEDCRVFAFNYALGALRILQMEALLENGEKILLKEVAGGKGFLFRGPAVTSSPIRSFVITLPQGAARVAFSLPEIDELWPRQEVRNRFDRRFSALEASRFRRTDDPTLWFFDLMRSMPELRFHELVPWDADAGPVSFEDLDLTGKTVREAVVAFMEKVGENPHDFETDYAFDVFEKKRPWRVHLWRWLHQRGAVNWLREHGLDGALDELDICHE